MTFSLPSNNLNGSLGVSIVPVIFDTHTNDIAQPNYSLRHKGEVKWECNDWMIFHKGLVKWFKEGRFKSKIKYQEKDAIAKTNEVFVGHWSRASWTLAKCGYGSEFHTYFTRVGLNSIFSRVQDFSVAAGDKTSKIVDSASNTLVNTVDNTGKIIDGATGTLSNFTNLAKYVVPVAIGGVVLFVGAYAYKNFIKGNSRISIPTPGGVVKV